MLHNLLRGRIFCGQGVQERQPTPEVQACRPGREGEFGDRQAVRGYDRG